MSAETAVLKTVRLASAPSASPFSKSSPWLAIWFVMWAKQTTGLLRASAKAYNAAASISTARILFSRWVAMAASVSRYGASVVQAAPRYTESKCSSKARPRAARRRGAPGTATPDRRRSRRNRGCRRPHRPGPPPGTRRADRGRQSGWRGRILPSSRSCRRDSCRHRWRRSRPPRCQAPATRRRRGRCAR